MYVTMSCCDEEFDATFQDESEFESIISDHLELVQDERMTLVIKSSKGKFFKNTSISTILTAEVYQGKKRIEDISKIGTIKWYKNGDDVAFATGEEINVSSIDEMVSLVAKLE